MSNFDPRITPARPDIAAASLKGKVEAERFVVGKVMNIAQGRVALRAQPASDSEHQTELLFGERFIVYENQLGWAWGQALTDSYVGFVHSAGLCDAAVPDYRVSALMTPLLPAPEVKRPTHDMLPLNAQVKVLGIEKGFARIDQGYVYARHLAPLDDFAKDWVSVAERFIDSAYVWGGKTHAGVDCSGLVQTALAAGGIASPRDTDMQVASLGSAIAPDLSALQRGDLIFWKSHVGIMLDATRLLHANAFHMQVAIEPLADAIARIAPIAGPITAIKRL